jgi:hypothetical protein
MLDTSGIIVSGEPCTKHEQDSLPFCPLLGAFGFAESLTDESQKANDGEWDAGGGTRYDVDHTIFIYCIQIYSSHGYNE